MLWKDCWPGDGLRIDHLRREAVREPIKVPLAVPCPTHLHRLSLDPSCRRFNAYSQADDPFLLPSSGSKFRPTSKVADNIR